MLRATILPPLNVRSNDNATINALVEVVVPLISIRNGIVQLGISGALCLLAALAGCVLAPAGEEKLDASLRETVHSVPVAAAGANIVVTSFRPSGEGPFPWIVLSHGTATTAEANRAIGRYRPLAPIREWVRRGYAVVAPVRRGYGASGGEHFGDAYGSCARPDFRRAGEGAALDLLATVAWAKAERDLDGKRWPRAHTASRVDRFSSRQLRTAPRK